MKKFKEIENNMKQIRESLKEVDMNSQRAIIQNVGLQARLFESNIKNK